MAPGINNFKSYFLYFFQSTDAFLYIFMHMRISHLIYFLNHNLLFYLSRLVVMELSDEHASTILQEV